jgi:hypothetical protein
MLNSKRDADAAFTSREEPYRVICRGPLFAVRWQTTTRQSLDDIVTMVERHSRLWGKLHYISITGPDSKLPDEGARREFLRVLRQVRPHLAEMCVVLEGQGFMAGTLRAIVASVRLIAPLGLRFHTCGTVAEAAARLEEAGGPRAAETMLLLERGGLLRSGPEFARLSAGARSG